MEARGSYVEVDGSVLDMLPWMLAVSTSINFHQLPWNRLSLPRKRSPLPWKSTEPVTALPWNLDDKTSMKLLESCHQRPRASMEPISASAEVNSTST